RLPGGPPRILTVTPVAPFLQTVRDPASPPGYKTTVLVRSQHVLQSYEKMGLWREITRERIDGLSKDWFPSPSAAS
ncbi:MAG: hypothetical protein ACXV5N_08960, partial [Halobacteriota archaeon]